MPVVCIEAASRRPQPVKMPPPPLAVGWKCSAATKKSLKSGLHPAFLPYIESSPTTLLCTAHFLTGDASPELPFHFPSRRSVRPRVIRCLRARVPSLLGPAGDDNAESESEEQVSPSISPLRIQAQEAELQRTRLPRDLGRRLHRQFPAYIVRKYTARREEEKNQLDCKGREKGYPERENRRRMSCCTAEAFFCILQAWRRERERER